MDYPNSVPGAGLVGGEFVNEDPVLGRQGSLIPAEWGNAVTKELVAVIEEDGQTPSESVLTQLRDALYGAVSSTKRRLLRIASSADMLDNDCDDAAVTPKKLRAGFSAHFGSLGYFAFPGWLGGLIFQWGVSSVVPAGVNAATTYPIAFTSGLFTLLHSYSNGDLTGAAQGSPSNAFSNVSPLTQFFIYNGGSAPSQYSWVAIGR